MAAEPIPLCNFKLLDDALLTIASPIAALLEQAPIALACPNAALLPFIKITPA